MTPPLARHALPAYRAYRTHPWKLGTRKAMTDAVDAWIAAQH